MPVTILFSPISGCQFLLTSFYLIWCLLLVLPHPPPPSFYFSFWLYLSIYLSIIFFSIWRLWKFSLFSQSVALLALSWNETLLNRRTLLGAQTGIKDSSFNRNIHKHPQTSCTDNMSFLIHVKILTIFRVGYILLCNFYVWNGLQHCECLSKTESHLVFSQPLLSNHLLLAVNVSQ